MTWVSSFWKFSRPHTIIGTSLSVWALYLISLATINNGSFSEGDLITIAIAWLVCLCGNVYIVGLNQLTDVEIDRINKPELPLASGAFSLAQGRWIIGITGFVAIAVAALSGRWLFATVALSLLLGTVYSLPPLRLKQFPLLAAFCILTVRGIVVNLGLFLHFSQKFLGQEIITANVWTLTLFILLFTIAIAIFKDVPDLEGDKKYNISTFTLILGKSTVFNISRSVITLCYLGMIAAGILWLNRLNAGFFIGYHLVLLVLLWWRSWSVDLEQKSAIASFYQFIWKLFFLEYLLFPLACFL
ncbi:4-hydroxybenzoate polyprenyltransferase-like prenyltransferase [Xenococcus sp. PCC 7305]|uniref:homogentisate phytyltransferase n=1 Tax=Xenococcus sp. PCC 7305 TaxID=102125 RepID=UPI0002AC2FFD|nr:homogentisate phytyltransferase [Xenococcus sp. PCC 7305]ELS03485.1 4-hydroxybenzoate polyprenyltransferase-like prenyltransferase [Xenococcus sp. PCC 7305]